MYYLLKSLQIALFGRFERFSESLWDCYGPEDNRECETWWEELSPTKLDWYSLAEYRVFGKVKRIPVPLLTDRITTFPEIVEEHNTLLTKIQKIILSPKRREIERILEEAFSASSKQG